MDEGELADKESGVHYRAALRRVRQAASGRTASKVCIDCGDKIPKARLALMKRINMPCERCVKCQALAERSAR